MTEEDLTTELIRLSLVEDDICPNDATSLFDSVQGTWLTCPTCHEMWNKQVVEMRLHTLELYLEIGRPGWT